MYDPRSGPVSKHLISQLHGLHPNARYLIQGKKRKNSQSKFRMVSILVCKKSLQSYDWVHYKRTFRVALWAVLSVGHAIQTLVLSKYARDWLCITNKRVSKGCNLMSLLCFCKHQVHRLVAAAVINWDYLEYRRLIAGWVEKIIKKWSVIFNFCFWLLLKLLG